MRETQDSTPGAAMESVAEALGFRQAITRLLGIPLLVIGGVGVLLALTVSWRLGVVAAIVSVLVGGALLLAHVLERYGFALVETATSAVQRWLQAREDRVSRTLAGALDGFGGDLPLIALFAVAVLVGLWGFTEVFEHVVAGDPLVAVDQWVFNQLQSLRTPAGDYVLVAITELGDRDVIIAVVVSVAAGLVLMRRRWAAIYLVIAAVGSTLFVHALKMFLHRTRPRDLYDGVSEFSFPSGHATSSLVVYGFLAILIARSASPSLRRAVIAAAVSLVIMIAFCRIYLGAHWLTDVTAGMAFGIAWTTLLAIIHLRHDRGALPSNELALLVAVTLLVAGGWHIATSHAADMARYAPAKMESGGQPAQL